MSNVYMKNLFLNIFKECENNCLKNSIKYFYELWHRKIKIELIKTD